MTLEEMIIDIKSLLSQLKLETTLDKDIIIGGFLTDYIERDYLPLDLRHEMVDAVMSRYNRDNDYELNESIFYFLVNAVYHVMTDRIVDFMAAYLADRPDPCFIEYALDSILDTDAHSIDKKQVIQTCLTSPETKVKEVTEKILQATESYRIYI